MSTSHIRRQMSSIKAYKDQVWRNGSKDTGWLEADVDMRNEVIIDPSLRLVYKERYKEDACQDYIELD